MYILYGVFIVLKLRFGMWDVDFTTPSKATNHLMNNRISLLNKHIYINKYTYTHIEYLRDKKGLMKTMDCGLCTETILTFPFF